MAPPTPENLELVERLEHELQLPPSQVSRAAVWGEWPHVLEVLSTNADGRPTADIATDLRRFSLAVLSPQTVGAKLRTLGWGTRRRRHGNERVQVLVRSESPKDQP